MSYKITLRLHIICLFIAFTISYLLKDYLSKLIDEITNTSIVSSLTPFPELNFFIILGVMVYSMAFIHEVIHAFFYKLFGGTVKIGFKYLYAYTQETSKIAISSYKFLIILLAPLVIMSAFTLPFDFWIAKFICFFNMIGSTGDMVMAIVVLKYGHKGSIIDTDTGFTVVYNQ